MLYYTWQVQRKGTYLLLHYASRVCTLIKNNENIFKSHCPENLQGQGRGEVSGNRLLFVYLCFIRTSERKPVILSWSSLLVKITHSPGKAADEACWEISKYALQMKWTALAAPQMCSLLSNSWKNQPRSIKTTRSCPNCQMPSTQWTHFLIWHQIHLHEHTDHRNGGN